MAVVGNLWATGRAGRVGDDLDVIGDDATVALWPRATDPRVVVCPNKSQLADGFLHNRATMSPPHRLRSQPQRTAAGQAELATRGRRLSQRQRTVLLLVDGRRSEDLIRGLAAQSGAGAKCLDDLVSLGLVAAAGAAVADATPTEAAAGESSLLPSSQSLLGASSWLVLDEQMGAAADGPLAEARELLMRAVRQEAPVSGALTLMKLKRAASRDALEGLLDEVELRLRKPHRRIIAAQTMRHVRHLLSLPAASHSP
jgi:hypothetical protein